MAPNKRKHSKNISEEDSLRQNRSSLQVNLSCTDQFTDSGNGSLRAIELEKHNISTDSMKSSRSTRSRTKLKNSLKEELYKQKVSTSKTVYFKDARVVLEDIRKTDTSLSIRCKKLTDAILSKTKETFGDENELSIRTSTVLQNVRTRAPEKSVECSNPVLVQKNVEIVLNIDDECLNHTNKNQQFQSLSTTLKKKDQKLSNKYDLQKDKLVQQNKCFNNKDLQEHVRNLRSDIPDSLPISRESSPILSGSRRTLNASRFVLAQLNKLSAKNELPVSEFALPSSYYKEQLHQCSLSSNESVSTAIPIAWSSVQDLCTTNPGKQYLDIQRTTPYPEANISTRKAVLSMEMTDVCDGFMIDQTNSPVHQCRNSSKNAYVPRERASLRNITTEDDLTGSEDLPAPTTMQKDEGTDRTSNTKSGLLKSRSTSKHELINRRETNRTLSLCNIQRNTDDIDVSRNSIRSSLNVNTSIDALRENNKTNGAQRKIVTVPNELCSVSQMGKNAQETIFEEEGQSITVDRTSLQMNTSLKAPSQSSFRDDVNLHNSSIDTIQIYDKISIDNDDSSSEQDVTKVIREQDIAKRNESKHTLNQVEEEKSYVEATPYPVPRSMMWRTIVRQNTELHSLQHENNVSLSHNKNIKRFGVLNGGLNTANLETIMSQMERNITAKATKNTTIILNDTNISHVQSVNPQNAIIIADSDAEVSSNTEKDVDKTVAGPKKKKLLPLRENSGLLSLTPVEENCSTPTGSVFPRKRKKNTRMLNKRKPNVKSTRNTSEHTKAKTKNVSLDDPPKEQPDKPLRRPRRIQSKKIVIKKLTNVNVLKKLVAESQGSNKSLNITNANRGSPNDFENNKYISSIKSSKTLAQKVVIVTTGLSKEDKNLVKSVIKSIGKGRMEVSVSPRTTHVVTTGVRTLNLLHAIIRGCWLVTMDWVLKSLENSEWLNPEEYEVAHYSKAVMANRKERLHAQRYGVFYIPDLFATCGFIHIANTTSPPPNALKDLIKAAGGQITESPQTAKIIIGSNGLRESWILDCVTSGVLQPFAQYKRN